MATIQLDIGGNTSRLDRDIQKTVNKVYSINLKTKGDQPLGRITGQVNEFTKSLDASNARVIAFGASAGIIYGVQKAFSSLVDSTIEVQKSLQDINVILNVSTQELNKFGGELFNIAKNTGQSFDEVAKAATEFSRQGLGVAETLKRTNEALILSRLSGLDAAKSVEALTAAVNSFASQAVTASEIVNKFANVDAAFAVSSADLAEAISRVGSSAAQSGVQLDELIAIVTAAQQTTARGGAVIGNSFKTIFTRLQRGKVLDLLESLGISTTDSSGQLKSTIQLLQDLGRVYDTLGARQQAAVAEQVGGVFQINILKAALADLGKEYSVYNNALNISASATNEAYTRNEQLNKTYAAQINVLKQNATQLAAMAGERLLGPAFERVVGGANTILGGINESDGTGVGAALGKGILDGLGQFIAGPGLAILGGVLIKLFKDLGKFTTGSLKQLLGLNTAAIQQQSLQQSINQILSKNPQLLDLALKGEQGLNAAANQLLANLQKQTVELQKQAMVAAQISKAFYGAGVRVSGGVPTTPTKTGKASGFIPNFASDKQIEKAQAIALGATPSVRAHMSQGTIGGRKFIMNNQETEYPGVGRNGDSMVIPKYAKGFVPNFAKYKLPENISLEKAISEKKYSRAQLSQRFGAEAVNKKLGSAIKAPKEALYASRLVGTRLPTILTPGGGGRVASRTQKNAGPNGENLIWNFPVRNANRGPLKQSIEATFGSGNFIDQWIDKNLIDISKQIAIAMGVVPANPDKFSQIKNAKGFKGAISGALGSIFDTAITTSLDIASKKDGGDFDVRGGENVRKSIAKLFGENALSKGKSGQWLGDIKVSSGPDAVDSMITKTRNEWPEVFKKTQSRAAGFIPNFSSTNRGVPVSQIRAHFDKNGSPIAVTNTRDEPNGLKDAISRERKGIGMYSRGFVPNFVDDTTSVSSGVAAVVTELVGLSYILSGSGQQYKNSIKEIADANNGAVPKMKRFGAAADAYGSAIAIGAPIIAATIRNMIPQDTKMGRGAAAATTGIGQAVSMGATGAQLGLAFGPEGAAVGAALGAAAGALMSLPDVIDGFTSAVPDLQKAAEKAAQDLTKFGDAAQKFNTSSEELSSALESMDPKRIKKAQDAYAQAMENFSAEDLATIKASANPKETVAQILEIKAEQANITSANLEYGKQVQETNKGNILSTLLKGAAVNMGITSPAATPALYAAANYFAPEQYAADTTKEKTAQKNAFLSTAYGGQMDPQKQLNILNKIQSGGLQTKLQNLKPGDTEGLKRALTEVLGNGEEAVSFINQAVLDASQNTQSYNNVTQNLNKSVDDAKKSLEDRIQLSNEEKARADAEVQARKEALKIAEQTISVIESNMRIAQAAAEAERALGQQRRQFNRDMALADKFTRPAETVKALVGEEAPLAQKFSLKSEMANIDKTFQDGVDKITYGFSTELNNLISSAATESIQTTIGEASGKEGAKAQDIKDAAEQAKTTGAEQIKVFNEIQGILDKNIQGNGQLDFESLKKDLTTKLEELNIDTKDQQAILQKLDEGSSSGNIELQKLVEEAKQSRLTLAKETTQKILIQKIGQAQKFAGGIDEYLNPPKKGESTFDKAMEAIKGLNKFQGQQANFAFDYQKGTNQFKYRYPEADAARKKQASEYGRAALNLIGGLQDYFGYTPDASGKAYQAGVAGLKENLDRQVAEFQKIANNPKTPDAVRDEISKALKEVEGLGGTGNIAAIQVAKKTGSLTEEGYLKITKKFNDPVLETLRQQNPELAMMKAAEMIISDDPTVKAVNKTNSILVDIRNAIAGGMENGVTTLDEKGNPILQSAATTTANTIKQAQKASMDTLSGLEKLPKPDGVYNNETGFRTFGQINQEENLRGIQAILGPNLGLGSKSYVNGIKQNPEEVRGIYGEPTSLGTQRDIASAVTSLGDIQQRNFGMGRSLTDIGSDVTRASYDADIKRRGLYGGDLGAEVERRKLAKNPLLTLAPQQITTTPNRIQPINPVAGNISLNDLNGPSPLSSLNSSIDNLNSAINNFVSTQQNQQVNDQTKPQQIQTTSPQPTQNNSIGPFNVVLNQSQGDISSQVNDALEKLKNEILSLVKVKVPPTSTPSRVQETSLK